MVTPKPWKKGTCNVEVESKKEDEGKKEGMEEAIYNGEDQ